MSESLTGSGDRVPFLTCQLTQLAPTSDLTSAATTLMAVYSPYPTLKALYPDEVRAVHPARSLRALAIRAQVPVH